MAARRPRQSGYNDGQLSLDSLWAEPEPERDEQVRKARDEPLAENRPGPLRGDPGAEGDVLFTARRAGRAGDPAAGGRDRRQRPAERGLPDQGGTPERGASSSTGAGARRADPHPLPGFDAAAGPGPAGQDDPPGRAGGDRAGRPGARRAAVAPPPVPRAPGRPRARVTANLEALHILRTLEAEQRHADEEERELLARWSSWGAVPQVFDETNAEWAAVREALHQLLDAEAWRAARRTTINAHYTDPAIAQAMWQTLTDLGFNGGRVLEPGAGGGTFIGLAPAGTELTGVELDPTTARIAQQVHPHATIRAESFAQTPLPDGFFDAAIGNVPFADVRLHDPRHNPARLTLHNHFIVKALALTRPGGVVVVLTSHFTMDAQNPAARRAINQLGELLGAVRLPTGAHRRTAGTDALTDLLILRRRDPSGDPDPAGWEATREVDVDGGRARINRYFAEHPERVRARTPRPGSKTNR